VFEAMGTPLVAGRTFSDEDIDVGARVALLNRLGALALWPSDDPAAAVGRGVQLESNRYTVVGIVGDIRRYPGVAPTPSLFLPITSPDARVFQSGALTVFRMSAGASLDRTLLRSRLDDRFPSAGVPAPQPVSQMLAPWMERPRFQAALFASFGVIALLLAAVGLYAVAAFDVARRRHEMGVRLTLGATGRDLRRLVIRAAVSPVLIGSTIGLLVTWWAAQFLQAFLFEVDARDPWTYGLVALTLVATAVVAAWLPARRAARTDPAMVLRSL
jgi:predicted lysophospholipase L1 biosynthesis ABC-type transport system permease subunit